MNILMLTNVFTPQVGGVTRSIEGFTEEFRRRGHRVLIVAPRYEEEVTDDVDVIRVPAIPKFYQQVYPLPLPLLPSHETELREFEPDVVHAHHPFLLGNTAQRISADLDVPLVYTHHSRYQTYIETKTQWPRPVEEAVLHLITGFCQMTDAIVAPTDSIRQLLRSRGLQHRIEVIPTGVDRRRFEQGDGQRWRSRLGIPPDAFVIGHVGRLAAEKNVEFLSRAVSMVLKRDPAAHFLLVGYGPRQEEMEQIFKREGVFERVHPTGVLEGEDLTDAYHAMDVFAFSSHSETQGMVLTEAMASGVPVVALDGTGVRDLVETGVNGRLLMEEVESRFAEALKEIRNLSDEQREELVGSTREYARSIDLEHCAEHMLELYKSLIEEDANRADGSEGRSWDGLLRRWETEWNQWSTAAASVGVALKTTFSLGLEDELDEGSI